MTSWYLRRVCFAICSLTASAMLCNLLNDPRKLTEKRTSKRCRFIAENLISASLYFACIYFSERIHVRNQARLVLWGRQEDGDYKTVYQITRSTIQSRAMLVTVQARRVWLTFYWQRPVHSISVSSSFFVSLKQHNTSVADVRTSSNARFLRPSPAFAGVRTRTNASVRTLLNTHYNVENLASRLILTMS